MILSLDQGTTSSRALLFGVDGRLLALAQRELRQHFPAPGRVEHDAQEIWEGQLAVAHEALAAARVAPDRLAAVAIANQRETVVLWERRGGGPLHRALVWQDRRTAARCDELKAAGHEPLVAARTGLRIDPYFSATKAAWLLDHLPDARRRAGRGELCLGTVESWLLFCLTGGAVHATDVTNASRTLLFDIHRGAWDDELLALFDVPREVLPRVVASSGVAGHCAPDAGLGGAPVAALAGDQQAALFGQLCTRPGLAKCTYGTGCFLLQSTGEEPRASRHGLLTTRAASGPAEGARFAVEGSVFSGGSVIQWLRDGLGVISRAADVEALAAAVPDSGGVVLVPAFTGLGAPHWDSRARGTICGLTRGSTRAHIARAALEAIALQVSELLEALTSDSGAALPELRVDGGAAANDLLMQLQADLLGVPVVRPAVIESTARGAAFLAGLAVGQWGSERELAELWTVERRFVPRDGSQALVSLKERWREAVSRARDWQREDVAP